MADKDAPPKYDGELLDQPAQPSSKPVVATLIRRKPGKIIEETNSMAISMESKDIIRSRNDALSVPVTATRQQLITLLCARVKVHFDIELLPSETFPTPRHRCFHVFSVIVAEKRVSIMDDAGWEASKGWLFDGTASLQFDFAFKPATLEKSGIGKDRPSALGNDGKGEKGKHKSCIVQ